MTDYKKQYIFLDKGLYLGKLSKDKNPIVLSPIQIDEFAEVLLISDYLLSLKDPKLKHYTESDFKKMRKYAPRTEEDQEAIDKINPNMAQAEETREVVSNLTDLRNFFTQTRAGITKICAESEKNKQWYER